MDDKLEQIKTEHETCSVEHCGYRRLIVEIERLEEHNRSRDATYDVLLKAVISFASEVEQLEPTDA